MASAKVLVRKNRDATAGSTPSHTGKAEISLGNGYKLVSFLLLGLVLMGSGCSTISALRRMEARMDAMTYYMGAMANNLAATAVNTGRIAQSADTMERSAASLVDGFNGKTPKPVKTLTQFAEAGMNNAREVAESLQGIRKELAELKHVLVRRPLSNAVSPDERALKDLEARLKRIEARLDALKEKKLGTDNNQ